MSAPQRRQVERPSPHRASWLIRVDQLVAHMIANLRYHWVGRAIFTIVLVLCLSSVWWSLHERLPLLKDSQAYIQKVNQLQTETETLKQQWRGNRVEQSENALHRHEVMLMPDMESVATWIETAVALAKADDFELSYSFGYAQQPSAYLDDIRVLPVTLSLAPMDGSFDLPAISRFFDSMTSGAWHVDIIRAELDGQAEGVEKITAELRVWMKKSAIPPQLESAEHI